MSVLLCLLLSSLVEVYSQTEFPYVSFMGETLLNHSYMDFTLVNPVECHTDLPTCCTAGQGPHRGDWYFPNKTRLPFPGRDVPIFEARESQQVDLHHASGAYRPSGIYRCDIPTNDSDIPVRETVYVGMYAHGGDVTISGCMTLTVDSDLNGPSPQFTLTCISTGGPATNVTWTRDSVTVAEGTETVLDDQVTAQYTHTLTVTGRLGGLYTCTVANSKPSIDSASYSVHDTQLPISMRAVQEGPTSIRVSWTPSTDATRYTIFYAGGGINDSVTVGSTNNYLLTGLQNGNTYTIYITATTGGLQSECVIVGLVPGQSQVSVVSATATSISLSWSVPSGSVVTRSVVMWQRNTSVGCFYEDQGSTTITNGSTVRFDIVGLEEDSSYSITMKIFNEVGSSSAVVTAMTMEAASSGPPTSPTSSSTATTITVGWGPVNCIDRNGKITSYRVCYREEMRPEANRTCIFVPESDDRQTALSLIISGLTPSTVYTIGVVAVNSVGTGLDGARIIKETDDALSALSVDSSSTTSLTISWRLAETLTATNYTISYSNTDCPTDTYDVITGIAGSETMYTLTGLEEGTEYSVTVTATLNDEGTRANSLTATTMAAAPSAPPSSVSATNTSFSITVQWARVDCIHRNGDIIGYSVRFAEVGSESTETMSVARERITLSSLISSTTYSIEVAAVNSVGTGVYSNPIIVVTRQGVYLSLNGNFIPNHGYVEIIDIGSTDNTALICNTNRFVGGSNSGGDWHAPDETRVGDNTIPGFRRNRDNMVVRLLKTRSGSALEGIYYCVVRDDTFTSQTVYVGLYNTGGGVVNVPNMAFTLNDGGNPQFTLTCISTGGPATTVTWTRDSVTVIGKKKAVIVNGVTAQYTHTLTVTGRLGGLYTCTVANSKPSGDSAQLYIEVASPPLNVTVTSTDNTVTVRWASGRDNNIMVTGYRVYYHHPDYSVTIVNVTTHSHTITERNTAQRVYTVTVQALSEHLPSVISGPVTARVPGPVERLSGGCAVDTSMKISWKEPSHPNDYTWNYTIIITDYATGRELNRTVLHIFTTGFSVSTQNLLNGVLYTATVFVTNRKGRGGIKSVLFYAQEEVPRAPRGVLAERVNDAHMRVSWTALSAEEARGCITNYTVHYWAASDSGLVMHTTTPHTDTSVVIGSLVAGETYVAQVSASNGAGTGVRSEQTTLSGPSPNADLLWNGILSATVAIFLIIAVTVIIVVVLIMRGRRKHGSNISDQCEVNSSLNTQKSIATTRNTAYEMTKPKKERDHEYETVVRSPDLPLIGRDDGGVYDSIPTDQ